MVITTLLNNQKPSQKEYNYRRLYDYAIEFKKGIMLSKPIKVYLLSLVKRNSLDRWIDEELGRILKWLVSLKKYKTFLGFANFYF